MLFGIPFLIGGPAFVAAHILALFAVNSRHSETAAAGFWALRLMWGAIGAFLLLGLIAALLGLWKANQPPKPRSVPPSCGRERSGEAHLINDKYRPGLSPPRPGLSPPA